MKVSVYYGAAVAGIVESLAGEATRVTSARADVALVNDDGHVAVVGMLMTIVGLAFQMAGCCSLPLSTSSPPPPAALLAAALAVVALAAVDSNDRDDRYHHSPGSTAPSTTPWREAARSIYAAIYPCSRRCPGTTVPGQRPLGWRRLWMTTCRQTLARASSAAHHRRRHRGR